MGANAGEGLDRLRRAMGEWVERRGWGPVETRSEVIHAAPGFRVRAYGGEGPPVVLVPAPIKRAYIWDLVPGRSVVVRLKGEGCRVYLLEWLDPVDDRAGLGDYAERMIGECVDVVVADAGTPRVFLAGHSLGGLFTAIYAALHPERVQGLILVGATLDFAPDRHVLTALVRWGLPSGQTLRRLPGTVLTAATVAAAPLSIGVTAWLDRLTSSTNAEAASILRRVERWSLDEMAFPEALAADVVARLYRENAFAAGTLVVNGRSVRPAQITAPLLAIADPRCALAPLASVVPVLRKAASRDVEVWRYAGDRGVLMQHAGMLVGHSAHRTVWPQVAGWIRAHGHP